LSKQQKDKEAPPLEGEVELPAKRTLVRRPLDSLNGIIAEATRVYRQVRDGKLDHTEGRSLGTRPAKAALRSCATRPNA
jgi:hypothetical protein